MYMYIIVVGGGPPTPLSPFDPHGVEFPPTAATFSVQMEKGFVVLTKAPDVETNRLVNKICLFRMVYINLKKCIYYMYKRFRCSIPGKHPLHTYIIRNWNWLKTTWVDLGVVLGGEGGTYIL